jgi:hypothetical protein
VTLVRCARPIPAGPTGSPSSPLSAILICTCGVRSVLTLQWVMRQRIASDRSVRASPINRPRAVPASLRSNHHGVRSSHAALLPYLLKVCSRGADPRFGEAHTCECLYDPHLRGQGTQPRLGPLAASILSLRWAFIEQAPQTSCFTDRGHGLWLCTSTADI